MYLLVNVSSGYYFDQRYGTYIWHFIAISLFTTFEPEEGVFAVNFELASLTKRIEKLSYGSKNRLLPE